MTKKRVADIVEELVIPIINDSLLELVEIEFVKEGPDWFLRVYIDKDGGVTLDDCQMVSQFLSDKLDEIDPIEQNYYLEVSSPGLDRTLKTEKDFEKYKGRLVDIYLYQSIEGKKQIVGELVGLQDGQIVIIVDENQQMDISRDKISKIKLSLEI